MTRKDAKPPTQTYELSPRSMLWAALIIGGIWLLTRLWPILIVIIGALILAGTLSPAVSALERRRLQRGWAVAIVFAVSATTLIVCALLIGPPLGRQLMSFITDAPKLQEQLVVTLQRNRLLAPLAASVRHFQPEKLIAGGLGPDALAYSTGAIEGVGYAVTSLVLALYFITDRDRTRGALYAVVPRVYHLRLARILLKLETIVGGYMRGQLITSLAIAVFVFALLTLLRVPGAVALAAFAALTDVIPFIGGTLASVPAVLATLERGVGAAGIVLGALMLYQSFESRILVPRVYGRALRLPPTSVIIALLIGGKLLGIVGALLTLPIAAGLRMMIEELRVSLPGDDSDDSAQREQDEREEEAYAALTIGAAPVEAAAVAVELVNDHREAEPE